MDLMEMLPKIPLSNSLADILLFVVAFNLMISGLSKGLEKIKDKTKSDVDNKAYEILHKAANFLQKIIDFASANVEHKKK